MQKNGSATSILAPPVAITDEALDEAKALIGVDLNLEQSNFEASRDTIRKYALGIGDGNPLYLDPGYAAGSSLGGLVAPPTFPYAIFSTIVMPGLLGIQGVYGRARWSYEQRIFRGDEITASARVTDILEKNGRRAGRFLIQVGETEYRNQRDEVVARCITDTVRVPRSGAAGGGLSHEPRELHRYSEAEMERIEADVIAEEVRGADPRFGEDVEVGESLVPVVKGPYEREDLLVFYAGALPDHYHTCERRWAMRRGTEINNLHPDRYKIPNSGYGHQDPNAARKIGMPGAYDNGCQRVSWFGHLMSNWMGDDGFLAELDIRVREPNLHGDTLWLTGAVTEVRRAGDGWRVGTEVKATNQLGTVTAEGTAVVVLPARGA